mgnify:FL=1
MKTLLFIRDMVTEEAAQKITDALSETRLIFSVNLRDRCVAIEGRNDAIYTAKVAIREAGYNVD